MASTSIKCGICVMEGEGVIDLAGGGGANPAVINWEDNSRYKSNQQWIVEAVSGHPEFVTIKNPAGNRLLMGGPGNTQIRAEVISSTEPIVQWQLWDSAGSVVNLQNYRDGDVVSIVSAVYSGLAIDLSENKKMYGTPFICHSWGQGQRNQQFKLNKV